MGLRVYIQGKCFKCYPNTVYNSKCFPNMCFKVFPKYCLQFKVFPKLLCLQSVSQILSSKCFPHTVFKPFKVFPKYCLQLVLYLTTIITFTYLAAAIRGGITQGLSPRRSLQSRVFDEMFWFHHSY